MVIDVNKINGEIVIDDFVISSNPNSDEFVLSRRDGTEIGKFFKDLFFSKDVFSITDEGYVVIKQNVFTSTSVANAIASYRGEMVTVYNKDGRSLFTAFTDFAYTEKDTIIDRLTNEENFKGMYFQGGEEELAQMKEVVKEIFKQEMENAKTGFISDMVTRMSYKKAYKKATKLLEKGYENFAHPKYNFEESSEDVISE